MLRFRLPKKPDTGAKAQAINASFAALKGSSSTAVRTLVVVTSFRGGANVCDFFL